MAALTTTSITYAGTLAAGTALSASDTAEVGSGSNRFLLYENTSATPVTVTITLPTTATPYTEQQASTVQYTLSATTGRLAIPLHIDYAGADGRATITHSAQPAGATVRVMAVNWGGGS